MTPITKTKHIEEEEEDFFTIMEEVVEKIEEEIQKTMSERRKHKSKTPEYRRLTRKIRNLEDKKYGLIRKAEKISENNLKKQETTINKFIEKLKKDFSDNYDIVSLEKDKPPHRWSLLTIYGLYEIFKEHGIPSDTLKKYRAGIIIRFHWFYGDMEQLRKLVEYIRQNKPKNIVVMLSFDSRPDHSETAYQLSRMVRFENRTPFQYKDVIIKTNQIVPDPIIFIL